MAEPGFFTEADGWLHPTAYSLSLWAEGTLNGPAVCAVAARAAELHGAREGFHPARFTIDLFRVARTAPTTTTATTLRDGGRVRVVEVDVLQLVGGPDTEPVRVARSTTVFLKQSTNPGGQRWARPAPAFEPPAVPDEDHYPRFAADEATTADGAHTDAVGWTSDLGALQGAGRKRGWTNPLPTVAHEPITPFVRAVVAAESTSLMGNWGTTGIALINCDLTVALSRLPRGVRVGVEADYHLEVDGVSVSNCVLFDAEGPIGTGVVTAVNNARAEIDFTTVKPEDRLKQA